MLKKEITYTDYNGVERTEDFYFNLSKAELAEMELSVEGGLSDQIKAIVNAKDVPSVVKIFKKIILKAYGEKSADGKRFVKSPEISEGFEQTEAYSVLFMELIGNPDYAAKFITQMIPADLSKQLEEEKQIG